MRFELKFLNPVNSGQYIPHLEGDPVVLGMAGAVIKLTVQEIVGDTPFSAPVPVEYVFRVMRVELPYAGGHNGALPTGGPTLVLAKVG